jgi:hypothetical protein
MICTARRMLGDWIRGHALCTLLEIVAVYIQTCGPALLRQYYGTIMDFFSLTKAHKSQSVTWKFTSQHIHLASGERDALGCNINRKSDSTSTSGSKASMQLPLSKYE